MTKHGFESRSEAEHRQREGDCKDAGTGTHDSGQHGAVRVVRPTLTRYARRSKISVCSHAPNVPSTSESVPRATPVPWSPTWVSALSKIHGARG